jgi:DNA-binding response OmpR family regulator
MTAPRRTILVVDDDAVLRQVLELWLGGQGHRVIAAGSAETAYDLVAAERPDALLLDSQLPTMSGLALYLAIVHRWPELEGRIAIMTGDADAPDVRAWLERHDCTVLRKPFDVQMLSAWLRAVWRPEQLRRRGDAGA